MEKSSTFCLVLEDDEKTKANFRTNPEAMVKHAKEIENRLNTLFPAMAQQGSNMQKGAIRKLHERMSKMITNPDLLRGRLTVLPNA